MSRMAGPGRNLIGEEEKKEILDVIETGHLFRYGPEEDPDYRRKVVQFEDEFKKYLNAKYCIAVNSGTSALMACLASLGIGPGDEVIVPGYTFIASLSSIIYSRAIPVLTEIDESLTIDPRDIERKITENTKAIMPVHMLGNPCDMDAVMEIAGKHGLYVLEDACQAVGGSYKGKKLGTIGDVGGFSSNHMKILDTGDGGALVTNDRNIYEKAFGFHDQGHKPSRFGEEIGNRSILGLNFRMNELTGAVALAQVRKLEKILSILRRNKNILKERLSRIPGINFRKINDSEGECSTLLTLLFEDKETADRFASKIGTQTVINSGWHVYGNMEQLIGKKMPTSFNCPFECKQYGKEVSYEPNMLQQTDDILRRTVNLSIGVVDRGLGAPFGINVLSGEEEIEEVGDKVEQVFESL